MQVIFYILLKLAIGVDEMPVKAQDGRVKTIKRFITQ
jgi:hypothetical protein